MRRRVLGRGTREVLMRHGECPGMLEHGLGEFCHVRAGAFYIVARPAFPLSLVVLCNGGSGRVTVGAQSFHLMAGHALLVPPGHFHEFRSDEGGWDFITFWYAPQSLMIPEIALMRLHSRPVAALVEALVQEHHGDADTGVMRHLVEIIDAKLRRMANPVARSDQLGRVWAEVSRRPDAPWDLCALAKIASISPEHLRRLAHRETGRSPMEQVAWLRMQRAANLLGSTTEVVEQIADRVGYASVRAFRQAFERCFGQSPRAYRQQIQRAFVARPERRETTGPAAASLAIPPVLEGRYPATAGQVDWRFLDLSAAINTAFADSQRPWFGQPLLHVRAGTKRIHGVPFVIARDGCVLLRSKHMPEAASGTPLPDAARFEVPRLIKRAYFLHACGWGSRPGPFAKYRFVREGGQAEEISLVTLGFAHPEEPEGADANIQDWYFAYDHLSRPFARPYDLKPRSDPTATSQFLYTLEWLNPQPDRPVAALEALSLPGHDATLALIAVTLEPVTAESGTSRSGRA